MAMDVGRKYITTYLGILDLPGVDSNIGHHVLKMAYNKIVSVMRYMAYKAINQNAEYLVLLGLDKKKITCGRSWQNIKGYNTNEC